MAELLANPIVIGVLVGMPSFLLGYLGYRRSQKADKATASTDAIGQIIGGLNALIDNLQDDNAAQRTQATECRDQVETLQGRLESTVAERDELKRTLAKLAGGLGIVVLLALAVGNQAKEHRLVERARSEGKAAGKVAAKAEVKEQVAEDIEHEVTDQLDDRLLVPSTFPTTSLPSELQPIEPVPTTPSGPFDLTTTTMPEPPIDPPPVTTTTTIEVPTTVTLPIDLPLP